jgi:hypothetical protein
MIVADGVGDYMLQPASEQVETSGPTIGSHSPVNGAGDRIKLPGRDTLHTVAAPEGDLNE